MLASRFFFGESGRESVALQAYVFPEPAFCLHHLERVGRCDENLGKKRVRIERDGRHKLVELGFVQTRLSGSFGRELIQRRLRERWLNTFRGSWPKSEP